MEDPQIIILISGKRKCGKDFIAEKLHKCIGLDKCVIVRISEPIKIHYAKSKQLNLIELLSDNPYKEQYRVEMIIWSDEIRKQNPGYFCNAACTNALLKPLWIVSDIRRKTDIKWFKESYGNKIKTVRLFASPEVRQQRGWTFTNGVDDVSSECDLDDYKDWDLNIQNDNVNESELAIREILSLIPF